MMSGTVSRIDYKTDILCESKLGFNSDVTRIFKKSFGRMMYKTLGMHAMRKFSEIGLV